MIGFLAALVEDRRLAAWTAGALAIIAGSAAPWVHVASPLRPLTELGLDADGKITILCGVAALILAAAYARLRAGDLAAGAAVASAASCAYAVVYLLRVRDASSRVLARMLEVEHGAVEAGFGARPGLGVWVVAAGSALALAAAAGAAVSAVRRAGRPDGAPVSGAKPAK